MRNGCSLLRCTCKVKVLHCPVQICQSYDTAEFCRNVHSCEDWQAAARQACITLGGASSRKLSFKHTNALF